MPSNKQRLQANNAKIEAIQETLRNKMATSGGSDRLPSLLKGEPIEISASDLDGVTAIRGYQFYNYPNELKVTIPTSVTAIRDNAFNQSKLTNIYFEPDSQLNYIGKNAFSNSSLKSIYIPKSVTEMLSSAFSNCTFAESLVFEQGCPLNSIAASAFYGLGSDEQCNGVELVDLSTCTQLNSILSSAFGSAKIHNMILPSTLTMIYYDGALPTTLKTLTVLAPNPPTMIDVYDIYAPDLTAIYVPKGSLSAYQSAEGWSSKRDIIVELDT